MLRQEIKAFTTRIYWKSTTHSSCI